jgi:dTDP-4-amino-4,6-dideoxygalactose transaminase
VQGGGRDALQQALAREGIGSAVYYRAPLHALAVYAGRSPRLPVAEAAAAEVLSLPIGPLLDDARVERVAEVVRGWRARRAA